MQSIKKLFINIIFCKKKNLKVINIKTKTKYRLYLYWMHFLTK